MRMRGGPNSPAMWCDADLSEPVRKGQNPNIKLQGPQDYCMCFRVYSKDGGCIVMDFWHLTCNRAFWMKTSLTMIRCTANRVMWIYTQVLL